MSQFAWVTLATNDSYSLGALVVAYSLKKVNTRYQTVVLITPGVSESMKRKLETIFNVVVDVNVLDSQDAANLALLSRPELGITFTKLHCWRLTQFEKCVFLDADTFVLQNCDELFEREELSAAPDVGWPDCFNSGVFVFRPSLETYGKLIEFAKQQGSFDGGDQGLLNLFFSDWASKDISKHLPFIYNTCSTACYSYLPAFKQFGQNVKILHFIGQIKPWLLNFDSSSKTAYAPQGFGHLGEYIQQWWNIFCEDVHPSLTTEMAGLAGALAQLTLGSPRSAQQQAYEDSMRRQCWEAGNIDYLGKDSFDNIWKRITQTIEIKSDTSSVPHPEKNRSPTPQPDEKLAVEERKEVKLGPSFNESEEDILQSTQVQEKIITEITTDGRVIEKKIVTYPGEEITEVEEIEEVDGQVVSVKRTVTGGEQKEVVPKPKTLAEIKNEPVVLVPGYRTVELDEKNNSTIVTEKTTTGYQQTITTTQEDGTKKIQTKTFYDPVEIPGEEEEVETYEEIETFEPGTTKTTLTTITGSKDAVESFKSQDFTDVKETEVESKNEKEVTNNTTTQTTTVVEDIENGGKTETAKQDESINVDQTIIQKETKGTKESQVFTDLKTQPVVIVPGHQKVDFDEKTNTTTVTEKTTTGHQQTITTITEDGRTIVQTKVFYDPVPLEEVEEIEETETREEIRTILPTVTKTTTITTTGAITDVVDSVTSIKHIDEVQETNVVKQVEEQPIKSIEQQEETKVVTEAVTEVTEVQNESTTNINDLQLVVAGPASITQTKTSSDGKETEVTTTVSEDGKTKTLRKTVRQPSEEIEIEEYEETHSYEPGEVKVITTTKTIPLVEALEEAVKDIVDESTAVVENLNGVIDKSTETITKQQEITQIENCAKETTTVSKAATTIVKERAEGKPKPNDSSTVRTSTVKTETKETTTAGKPTKATAKQTTNEAKEVTSTAKQTTTTAVKQTTTETKETATSAKKTANEAKQTITEAIAPTKKITSKNIEKNTKTTTDKSTVTSKKVDSQNKTKPETAVKKESSVKDDSKTSKSTTSTKDVVATVDKPKVTIKNGEKTTEVVRRVPGGTEHTWTTVRADGTTKVESKTIYDVVEIEGSDEEEEEVEEYEEIIEEDEPPVTTTTTTTTKKLAPVTTKGIKTPTVTEATPPNTPPLKPLVISGPSSDLKVEHEILDTPPLDKAEQLRKKKLQSAPASKVTPKVEKSAVETPKPPPRKKEVKKPATGK